MVDVAAVSDRNEPTESVAKMEKVGNKTKTDILEFQMNMKEQRKILEKHSKTHLGKFEIKLKLTQNIKSEVHTML